MNISRVENTPTRRVLERKQIDVSLVWFGFVFWGGWWGLVGFEVHMPRSSSSFTLTFLTKLFNYSTTSESCTYKYYIYIYIYICMYVCMYKQSYVVGFSANTCQRSNLDLVPSYLRCLFDLGLWLFTIT